MSPEDIAAIYEAAEEISDDALVLALMLGLREPEFREDIRALMSAPPSARRAARPLLSRMVREGAANA